MLTCYEKLQAAASAFALRETPNLKAVARKLAEQNPALNPQALEAEAMQRAQPTITWFLRKFNVDL